MINVLLDSGFVFAYCDDRDSYNENAKSCDKYIMKSNIYKLIIPCSVLYEVLSTKFVKNKKALENFEKKLLHRANLEIVNSKDCENLVKDVMTHSKRNISLTDMHLRSLIQNRRIDILITCNSEDFLDVVRNTEIIDIRHRPCS